MCTYSERIKPRIHIPLEVSNDAFFKFTYGVEVLTTQVDGVDYGCIINTAGQVAAGDIKKITISCIKQNHTCDMVAKAGKFNISILTEDAPFALFQQFGFQSPGDSISRRLSCLSLPEDLHPDPGMPGSQVATVLGRISFRKTHL